MDWFSHIIVGVGLSQHVGHCNLCNEEHLYAQLFFKEQYEHIDYGITVFNNSGDNISAGPFVSVTNGRLFGEVAFVTGYEYLTGLTFTPAARVGVQVGKARFFAFPSAEDGDIALGLGVQLGYTIEF